MTSKASFNPYGVTLHFPDGDVVLNAGAGMTILPNGDLITFSAQIPSQLIANGNGLPWQPPTLTDGKAPNNSIYYSSDAAKLVYKSADSVVHPLY